jgi:farnesol dehydrogenase
LNIGHEHIIRGSGDRRPPSARSTGISAMKVLVTGGTGYLGQAIVRALVRGGHAPVVFARAASRHELPARSIDGDVRDRGAVERAVEGLDAVCHAAALVSLWRARSADFDEVNIGGLQNVIDAVGSRGLARLVYTSSFLALPPAGRAQPIVANDYQRTKVAGLELARAAGTRGVPIVSLVPGVIYGPGPASEGNLVGRLVRDHLGGRLPGIVGADRAWSFSHVDDVANAHVAALTHGAPGAQHVVGGENAPQMRLFEIVRQLRGRALPRRVPYPVANALGAIEEARVRIAGGAPAITRGAVEIFRHDWPLDSQASTAALGYRVTPLERGLEAMLGQAAPA